jgi:cyclophilin family peptidyl-prolyl cis-trans isomerase
VLEQLKEDYGDQVRLIFRHLPLISIHDNALISSEAAEAAGAQGKFWEMHDLLFANQGEWSDLNEKAVIEQFVAYAEEAEVPDVEQFKADLENRSYEDKVMAAYEEATAAGLTSTPTLLYNQVDYPVQALGFAYQNLEMFVKLTELRAGWYEAPEQVIDPARDYQATIETENGDIVLDLFVDTAPVNVNSFAFLAQQGYYQNATFHRVLPGFVAQGGDPTGTGIGFPGYRCGDEVTPERQFDEAGMVALANSGPNTNGSQFFITYGPVPNLNAGFTIIGQVTDGLEVAEQLTPRDPQAEPTAEPGDKIIDILIEEKN